MNYAEAIAYYESTFGQGAKASDEDFRAVLAALGNPHKTTKIIHVAGTNGKGSVCAIMGSVLRAAGYSVGVFTSPHLTKLTERFRLNGRDMAKDDFALYLTRVRNAAIKTGAGFSYFQLLTLVCFAYFADRLPDYLILESGIGGLCDCTNVAEPVVSVITRIGLDHMPILGDTIELIAAQKAGIIKPKKPVATAPQRGAAMEVIQRAAASNRSVLYLADDYAPINIIEDLRGFSADFPGLPGLRVNLAGVYQVQNAQTALAALKALCLDKVGDKALREGFRTAVWRGRFEVVCESPLIILDGAHNEDGAMALAQTINRLLTNRRLNLILAILDTKDWEAVLRALVPLANSVVFTKPSYSFRAVPPKLLAESARKYAKHDAAVSVAEDYRKIFPASGGDNDVFIVAGSLYLIGDIRNILVGEAND